VNLNTVSSRHWLLDPSALNTDYEGNVKCTSVDIDQEDLAASQPLIYITIQSFRRARPAMPFLGQDLSNHLVLFDTEA
jgi:hypothetical protein